MASGAWQALANVIGEASVDLVARTAGGRQRRLPAGGGPDRARRPGADRLRRGYHRGPLAADLADGGHHPERRRHRRGRRHHPRLRRRPRCSAPPRPGSAAPGRSTSAPCRSASTTPSGSRPRTAPATSPPGRGWTSGSARPRAGGHRGRRARRRPTTRPAPRSTSSSSSTSRWRSARLPGGAGPLLEVLVGDQLLTAGYLSSPAPHRLTFRLLLPPGAADQDGIALGRLLTTGGTIADTSNNPLSGGLDGVPDLSGVLVAGGSGRAGAGRHRRPGGRELRGRGAARLHPRLRRGGAAPAGRRRRPAARGADRRHHLARRLPGPAGGRPPQPSAW